MKVEIKVVEIPDIDLVRNATQLARDEEARLCVDKSDRIRLIEFINEKIKEACNDGKNYCAFSIDDEYYFGKVKPDIRCPFRFKGFFEKADLDFLVEIYSNAGYSLENSYTLSDSTYRRGYIRVSW